MLLINKGKTGNEVRTIQAILGLTIDGIFGPLTEKAVKEWEGENNFKIDGVISESEFEFMISQNASTDLSENLHIRDDLYVNDYMLKSQEYFYDSQKPIKPEYIFIHHTAGWHNPYRVVDAWERDKRGRIATQYVIGGQSIKGNDSDSDGEIVKTFPDGGWAHHLGRTGSTYMNKNSIGIELCNFGYLKNGKTYVGIPAHQSQKVILKENFKGHTQWHKYSNSQLMSLKNLLKQLGNKWNIDIREGLQKSLKQGIPPIRAFDFNNDAYNGRIYGILSHSNVRKDKTDVFPQEELIDVILSL